MAELNLNIHGHTYGVACDDGQEERVYEVGEYVNQRATDIATAGAASNLTSLVLADEIKELRDHLQAAQTNQSGGAPQQGDAQGMSDEEQARIAGAIDQLSSKIIGIADRLVK